jgi:hypothetical protein
MKELNLFILLLFQVFDTIFCPLILTDVNVDHKNELLDRIEYHNENENKWENRQSLWTQIFFKATYRLFDISIKTLMSQVFACF